MILSSITRKQKIITIDNYEEALILRENLLKEELNWYVEIELISKGVWQLTAVADI